MTRTWTSLWRFGYVAQDWIMWIEYFFYGLFICSFIYTFVCLNFSAFRCQQAANIVRALELFVKPDVLSGENAYMCAK